MMFADPRAVSLIPVGDNELYLFDNDQRVLASAICYGDWWGVCSERSGVPIDRRAFSPEEARNVLATTVWTSRFGTESDEFWRCSERTKQSILYIRSLTDEEVLEAARDAESPSWKRIAEMLDPEIPRWITVQCAETAYWRDLMEAEEMDSITG